MNRDIVLFGASAGGIPPLQKILSALPKDLSAAILVVVHTSPESPGVLPTVLTRTGGRRASFPKDEQRLAMRRTYVAPPDHHLLVENQRLRVIRGPRENRSRPAIDPLFRSAAAYHGPRVIGIILSGLLDDGAAGLAAIKACGGVTIVQDPKDALFPSMPRNALKVVRADYKVPAKEIATLIQRIVDTPVKRHRLSPAVKKSLHLEADIAAGKVQGVEVSDFLGKRSSLTCPECGGTLWEMGDDEVIRFRCHIGHAYTADSLFVDQSDAVTKALSLAFRTLEDSANLAAKISKRAKERHDSITDKLFEARRKEALKHAGTLRRLLLVTGPQAPKAGAAKKTANGHR